MTFGTGQRYDETKLKKAPGVGSYVLPSAFDLKPKARKKPKYISPIKLKKKVEKQLGEEE